MHLVFSEHILFVGNLICKYKLKYYLYIDDSQVYPSITNLYPSVPTKISACLSDNLQNCSQQLKLSSLELLGYERVLAGPNLGLGSLL